MKICFISNFYYPFVMGGAEISVQRAAEGLVKRGHEVFVITTSPVRRRYREEINGVYVYRLGMVNIYPYPPYKLQKKPILMLRLLYYTINLWNPFSYAIVRNIFKREKPDIVHINHFEGLSLSVFSAVMMLKLPLVFTLRDLSMIGLTNNVLNAHNGVVKTVYSQLYHVFVKRILTNKLDIIITASQFARDQLRENGLFMNTEVTVLPNAIELDDQSFNIKKYDTIDMLYVGAIVDAKGIDILLNSFKELQSENIRLHIVGEGKDEEKFKRLAGADQRITFYGFKTGDELAELYKRANVLIAPTLCLETFGRIIIESFKYGTPVIGSNIGGYPELIKNGYNGFLFEAGNVNELKDILENLLENSSELKRLEEGAFESVKKYDIDEHIRKLEKLYMSAQ